MTDDAINAEVVALVPVPSVINLPPDVEATFRKYEEAIPADKYIQILTTGNFSSLQESECAKFLFIHAVRKGLDPWRQPYIFIVTDGKRVLYPRKEAAAQLREKRGLTAVLRYAGALRMEYTHVILQGKEPDLGQRVELVPAKFDPSIYETVWDAVDSGGIVLATDVGTADLGGVTGNARKNTIMAAYTRGKRRVILDAAGMGDDDPKEPDEFLDDSMPKRKPLPAGPKRSVPRAELPADVPASTVVEDDDIPFGESASSGDTPATTVPTPVPMRKPSKPPSLPQA